MRCVRGCCNAARLARSDTQKAAGYFFEVKREVFARHIQKTERHKRSFTHKRLHRALRPTRGHNVIQQRRRTDFDANASLQCIGRGKVFGNMLYFSVKESASFSRRCAQGAGQFRARGNNI